MVDDPTAGKRFSKDLRRIREERNISIDEVHNKTRIARTLIESFEEGHLYEHESYNRVYLRSFVRAYAEAIEISVQRALDGLDAALDGAYEDVLVEEYVGGSRASEDADGGVGADEEKETGAESRSSDPNENGEEFSNVPSAGGPDGRGGIVGPPRAVGEGESEDEDSPPRSPDASSQVSSPSEESEAPSGASASDSAAEDDQDASSPERPSPDPFPEEQASETEEQASGDGARPEEEESEHDDDSDDDIPAWMEEAEEAEEEEEPEEDAPAVSQQDDPDGTRSDTPPAGMGEGGIVGEPTPLGSSASEEGASLPRSQDTSPSQEARPSRSSSAWNPFSGGGRRGRYLAGAGIVVVAGVLILLGVLFFSSDEPSPEEASTAVSDTTGSTTSSPDTSAAAPERPPPADLTLGETLHLTVRATSNVGNLRIRRDEDLRRPYWIQEGDASVFPFEQEVTLQNQLGDIELFLEGYPYPMPSDTTGGIEITRSQAEAFADTLRGAPASFSVTPDTIPLGAPTE